MTELYWIEGPWPGRLAISARTRGGYWLQEEICSWRQAGVRTVVSLLTAAELEEFDLSHEPEASARNGVPFLNLPIKDRQVPASESAVEKLAEQLRTRLARGANVNIRCRQGIGRSSLIAGAALIEGGINPTVVLSRIAEARDVDVPETAEQRAWIDRFAESAVHRR